MKLKIAGISAAVLFAMMVSMAYAEGDDRSAAGEEYAVSTYAFETGLLPGTGGCMAIGSSGMMGIFGSRATFEPYNPSTVFTVFTVTKQAQGLQTPGEKDPFLAGLLSWFMLGIGQIYVGDYTKGSLFIAAGFVDKVALVLLISHINSKYAPSADEIVNLNWKSFDGSTKILIVSYLVSSFGLRFYSVVDAVHSAHTYNRRLYGQSKREGLSFELNSGEYSITYNFQFND